VVENFSLPSLEDSKSKTAWKIHTISCATKMWACSWVQARKVAVYLVPHLCMWYGEKWGKREIEYCTGKLNRGDIFKVLKVRVERPRRRRCALSPQLLATSRIARRLQLLELEVRPSFAREQWDPQFNCLRAVSARSETFNCSRAVSPSIIARDQWDIQLLASSESFNCSRAVRPSIAREQWVLQFSRAAKKKFQVFCCERLWCEHKSTLSWIQHHLEHTLRLAANTAEKHIVK
jgi:hypothetical protein